MSESLSAEHVEHVAKLARLRLTPEQVEQFRGELSSILAHVEQLSSIDVDDVEAMAHPLALSNRLAADEVGPTMPLADLIRNAPAVEGPFVAVPKVLGDGGGA